MTQKSRSSITTEIASLLADNGTGAITAANLRTVVQDINDSAGSTLTDTAIQVGASGTAGSLNVFPATASKGTLIISAINNTGNFNSTITNADIGQATTYSLPDAGNATAIILTDKGTQSVTGTKTFTTPVLGVATATSINKMAITAPATSSTLAVADGKTFTVSNTITVAGTDSTTITLPTATSTVARINPPPQAGGSTLAVTAAMSGRPILLDTAGGTTATLPAATGTGNRYRFIVSVSATSNAHKILAASVSDFIVGLAYGENANTAKCFASPAATNHSLQMPFAGTQPSGGFIGDVFELADIGTNLWHCYGMYQAGVTPTTPFSSATT